MSISQRYNSKTAALYRDKISSLAEGREWNRAESESKIGKMSNNNSNHSNVMTHSKSTSAINSYQESQASFDQGTYQTREFRDQRDNFFNNLQAQNAQR